MIVHREKCEVLAQLGHELVLRPEGQRANTRMHTVGADQEVVALRCGPGEGDCDLRAVIAHAGDRIGETKHDVFAYRLVQDARKIAPQDLQFPADDLRGKPGDFLAVGIDHHQGPHVRGLCPHRVEHTHFVQHVDGRTPEIDGLTAISYGRGTFDDRDGVSFLHKPVRQRRARDTATADEDLT